MFKLKRFLLLALFFVIALPTFSESNSELYRYWVPSDIIMKYKLRGKLKHLFSTHDFTISTDGKMYIVANKGGVFVYDETEQLWQSVDQVTGHLIGTLKQGLRAKISKKIVLLDPQKLDRINGYATRIAVSPGNQLWVVTRDHTIYRRQGDHWQRMPGLASDIDIGKDGSIWALGPDLSGTEQRARSQQPIRSKNIRDMSKWDGRAWQSIALNRHALNKRIHGFSVSGAGTPWIIQDFRKGKNTGIGQRVLAWDGEQWQDKSPPGSQYTLSMSKDEEGVIWVCTNQIDNSKLQNRPVNSLMFWRDKRWFLQHHIGNCADTNFQFYQKQVWSGPQQTLTEAQPSIQDGWVVNPIRHQTITGMDANGALWFENNIGISHSDLKRRWHGGNNWSLGKPTSLLERPSSYSTSLFSQSINQHSFRVVNTAPKPRIPGRKRPIRLQVVNLDAKPEIILNGVFRHISSLAIDGEDVPWVMGLLKDIPNTDIFRGPFKYSGGNWQRMPVNIPQISTRLMSGRDGAISIGGRTQAGKATAATWKGEGWQLTELPSLFGRLVAFTDSRGKVWAQDDTNIYYQQGASVWHKENSLVLVPVLLKKSKKFVLKPKKKESANLKSSKKRSSQVVKKDRSKPEPSVRQEKKKEKQPPGKQNPTKERMTLSLVGCWKWSNGMSIKVSKNGSANLGLGPAPWRIHSNNEFEIDWPGFRSDITLSADGQSLRSIDNLGVQSTAQRRNGETNSLVGNWLWDNGGIVSIQADGTMLAGQLRGTWSGSGRKNKIVWPILDRIKVLAGGNKLEGNNQFGSFTATREATCRE